MMWQRIVTACVLIPLVIAGVLFTTWTTFTLVAAALFLAAAWEWARLCEVQSIFKMAMYVGLMGLGLVGLFLLPQAYHPLVYGLGVALWVPLLYWTLSYRGDVPAVLKRPWSRALIGLGVLWLAWFGLIQIRLHPQGPIWILCLILIVCSSDTAAYFTGKAFGKRLFAPLISPKKTWAGFWGGLIGAFGVALFCFWGMGLSQAQLPYFVPMALVLILLAIYGDLLESLIKRAAHKKDSGTLLPGHGGLLDRLDSLLPTLPFFAWYLQFIK